MQQQQQQLNGTTKEQQEQQTTSRSSGCRDVLEVQEQEPEERVEEQMTHCQQPDGMPQEQLHQSRM